MTGHAAATPTPDLVSGRRPSLHSKSPGHWTASARRQRSAARTAIVAALLGLLGLLGPSPLAAQTGTGWVVRSSASVDLWFHSMALTGFDAFGAVPLYQPGYATDVRRARERADRGPTRLEREARAFQSAFAEDPVFEVLHFVPIYFAAADVDQMLDALTALATEGERAASRVPSAARFGVAAVASVLTTPTQRATLARFVAAVRDEWTSAYLAERSARATERHVALQAASDTWTSRAGPAMAKALAAASLDGGIILASPALGPEGRLFAGRPTDRSDNVVAVRLDLTPAAAGDAAWLAVREMSFPSARQALLAAGAVPQERQLAELTTGRAAAHLGAAHLAGSGATAVDAYRRALLRVLGLPVPAAGDALKAAFAAAYPLAPAATAALGARKP